MEDETVPTPSKLGKYEVRSLLGRGSMGMVFLGRDPLLERDVAIKVMVGGSVYDERMRLRFEREAKAVARLHHPNIVTIHDLGYDPHGSPYIAMELLEGTDLEELIELDPPTLGRRLEIVSQACRGLEHAHRHGIVHRDIKPANIFVAKDGVAKIMDFGVARSMQSSQTQRGIVVGTAGYMSPEQLRGKTVDGRSDVFSLGIVLYEVLTNRLLFYGEAIESIFFQTLNKETPVLIRPDGTELPALQRILNRALAKDVERRFSSAEEMMEAIQGFLVSHKKYLPMRSFFGVRETESTEKSGQIGEATEQGGRIEVSSDQVAASRRSASRCSGSSPRRESKATGDRPSNRRSTGGMGRTARAGRRLTWKTAAALSLLATAVGVFLFMSRERRGSFAEEELPREDSVESTANQSRAAADPSPPPGARPESAEEAEPTPRERAALLAADAAIALGNGELDRAESLIGRGEGYDPGNPRWAALREQLQIKQHESQRKSKEAEYVREGRRYLDEGAHRKAVEAFREALEYDPENQQLLGELDQALKLEREAESEKTRTAVPLRVYQESDTEFLPASSDSSSFLGFETEESIEVKETADPFFPAQIRIEVNPVDARPGEPYVLHVSVFNEGYVPIEFQSIELVSRYGDKTTGKGQMIPLRVGHVAPQTTSVVHEVSGTWNESQNHGEIRASLTMADGSKLQKTIRW